MYCNQKVNFICAKLKEVKNERDEVKKYYNVQFEFNGNVEFFSTNEIVYNFVKDLPQFTALTLGFKFGTYFTSDNKPYSKCEVVSIVNE